MNIICRETRFSNAIRIMNSTNNSVNIDKFGLSRLDFFEKDAFRKYKFLESVGCNKYNNEIRKELLTYPYGARGFHDIVITSLPSTLKERSDDLKLLPGLKIAFMTLRDYNFRICTTVDEKSHEKYFPLFNHEFLYFDDILSPKITNHELEAQSNLKRLKQLFNQIHPHETLGIQAMEIINMIKVDNKITKKDNRFFNVGIWANSPYMKYDKLNTIDTLSENEWNKRKNNTIELMNPHFDIVVPTFHYVPLIGLLLDGIPNLFLHCR
jgi:hypothetical protein